MANQFFDRDDAGYSGRFRAHVASSLGIDIEDLDDHDFEHDVATTNDGAPMQVIIRWLDTPPAGASLIGGGGSLESSVPLFDDDGLDDDADDNDELREALDDYIPGDIDNDERSLEDRKDYPRF